MEVVKINIIEYLRFKKKYSFDANVMVVLSLLVAAESLFTLLSAIYIETSRERIIYWTAVLIFTLFVAELAVNEKHLNKARFLLIYGVTFVIIPLWVLVHGNIALAAILYIVTILLALNMISTRIHRIVINSFMITFMISSMGHEYLSHNYIIVMPIEGNIAIYYIIIIPIVLMLAMGFVVFIVDKYKNERLLLEKKNKELSHLVRIDALTGLYNKQFLNEQIKIYMSISRRTNVPLSVLVLDIDYFKNYNDQYGHMQGDDCLVKIAEIIKKSVHRGSDNIFRFGGEEFVLLLHNVNASSALEVGQRVVDNVREAKIENSGSQIDSFITVSAGLFTYDGKKEMTTNSVIRMADEALYMAKNEGRNKICTLSLI